MKKLLLILTLFLLVSCGDSDDKGVVEETGEIVNDYVDTLEGSIKDAKEVQEMMNLKTEEFQEDLDKYKN